MLMFDSEPNPSHELTAVPADRPVRIARDHGGDRRTGD